MASPQLLVGKVAAITGGLTGIGRVSDYNNLQYGVKPRLVGGSPQNYPGISWLTVYSVGYRFGIPPSRR